KSFPEAAPVPSVGLKRKTPSVIVSASVPAVPKPRHRVQASSPWRILRLSASRLIACTFLFLSNREARRIAYSMLPGGRSRRLATPLATRCWVSSRSTPSSSARGLTQVTCDWGLLVSFEDSAERSVHSRAESACLTGAFSANPRQPDDTLY